MKSKAKPEISPVMQKVSAYIAAAARGGFTFGPGQGLLISEMILGQPPSTPIGRFDPARLLTGAHA